MATDKTQRRPAASEIITREMTVHLHKYVHGKSFKDRAPRAVKAIRAAAQKAMSTQEVRVEPRLNKAVWAKGIRNVPRRIRIRCARRRNEEEGEGKEKFYTYVTLVEVPSFKGLQTEVVEA